MSTNYDNDDDVKILNFVETRAALDGNQRLLAAQGQRLDNSRIGLATFSKLFQREFVVVVLIHLIEDFVNSFLRRILVFGLWLLSLKHVISCLESH